MPGNGKVFVSYAPEDAQVCLPLFAALDAWEVDYHAAPAALDPAQQIPPAVQRDIAERDVYIRVCSPAAQHSVAMNLQVSVFRAMQAGERQRSRRANRALINLILVPGYVREPFDNATIFIDATNRPRQDWLNELGRALGVTLLRSRLSRRAVLGLGVAGVATVASLSAGSIISARLPDAHAAPQSHAGPRRLEKEGQRKALPSPTVVGDAVYAISETGVYTPIASPTGASCGAAHPREADLRRSGGIGNVLYVSLDSTIYALNTASGSKRWSVALESGEDLAAGRLTSTACSTRSRRAALSPRGRRATARSVGASRRPLCQIA